MGRRYFTVIAGVISLSIVFLAGCSGTKEVLKGLAGVSTKVLEEGRKDALKKDFNYDLMTCYNDTKAILTRDGSYIYADELKSKRMIAIYISYEDTTPVGIFFSEISEGQTRVEISSPSIYGKETIAKRLFTALEKGKKGQINAVKK